MRRPPIRLLDLLVLREPMTLRKACRRGRTASGRCAWCSAAGRGGAYNFLAKPFENQKLLADVKCAIERKEQNQENNTLRRALETMSGTASPIFRSAAMQEVVRTVERIAPSDVAVLITGESGTGKEVIADLIHALSPRSKNKIIKINCAALPRELIESELFGSVKGAFTGAHRDREGLFRQAEGGTLLLDEISEMPIDTQSKLLRVLQDQEVRPVGGKVSYKTNCRVIASTNRKPEEAIKDGKLREDLYYRISAISVHLPPLRERREDIMPLANAFLKRFAAQANHVISGFTPAAIERLTGFDWPGNVRQLQNEVQRAVLLNEGNEVDVSVLSVTNVKAARPKAPTRVSPCSKAWNATPSSRRSRKPAGTSWKPPSASASAARPSTTKSRPTASRFDA